MRGLQEGSGEAKDLDASTIQATSIQKKRVKQNTYPSCGESVEEPYKTRELVVSFPGKKMQITVAIFGMFKCPLWEKALGGLLVRRKWELKA